MPALFQLGNVLSHQFPALLAALKRRANDTDVSNACDWRGV